MLTRRGVLKSLAALSVAVPTVSLIKTSLASQDTLQVCTDRLQMAKLLGENIRKQYWTDYQKSHAATQSFVCLTFCSRLLPKDPLEDYSAPYFPDQDPLLLRKEVVFGVMTSPAGVYGGMSVPALSRKVRIAGIEVLNSYLDDLRSFHGIAADAEIADIVGSQAGLEICYHVRREWLHGNKVRAVGIYLPPTLVPSYPSAKMVENGWSFDSSWRVRYAVFT